MELDVDVLLRGDVASEANRSRSYCENSLYSSHDGLVNDWVYCGWLVSVCLHDEEGADGGIERVVGGGIGSDGIGSGGVGGGINGGMGGERNAWFHVYTKRADKCDEKKTVLTLVDRHLLAHLPRQQQKNVRYKILLQCDNVNHMYKYPVSKLLVLYPDVASDDINVIRPCDIQRLLQYQLAKSGDRINFHNTSFDIKVYPCTETYGVIAANTQVCILPKQESLVKSYIAMSHGASSLAVSDDLYLYNYMLQLYQSTITQQLSNYLSVFMDSQSSMLSSLLLVSSDVFHKDISAVLFSMVQLHRGARDTHYLTITTEDLISNGKNGKYLQYFYRSMQLVHLLLCHHQKVVLVLPDVDDTWDSFPDVVTAIIDLMAYSRLSNLFIIGISSRINNEMKGAFLDTLFMSLPSHAERKRVAHVVIDEIEKHLPTNNTLIDREKFVDRALDAVPRCVIPSFVHAITTKYKHECGNTARGVTVAVSDPFSEVIGLTDIKQVLTESIVWPTKYGYIYRDLNMSVDVGVLLYGPPGTGKTKLPKVIATTLRYPLLVCKLSDIVSGEIGTSEKKLSAIFQEAKGCSPCIIFIDEMQALFTNRADNDEKQSIGHSLSSTLAVCLDDIYTWNNNASTATINNQITIIASTNEPWAIDISFLRPGRFDKLLFVGPLSETDRWQFIAQRTSQIIKDECIINPEILQLTDGFTGADMTLLMQKLMINMRSSMQKQPNQVNSVLTRILSEGQHGSWEHVNTVLTRILSEGQIKRSVAENELLMYSRWQSPA